MSHLSKQNPFSEGWAARRLAEQSLSPTQQYEQRLSALREGEGYGSTVDGIPQGDNSDSGIGSSCGDHTAQVGDLVRSIAVSPSLDVTAKLAKIKSALKLLDDSGPVKPADSPGDGADAAEDDEVN